LAVLRSRTFGAGAAPAAGRDSLAREGELASGFLVWIFSEISSDFNQKIPPSKKELSPFLFKVRVKTFNREL